MHPPDETLGSALLDWMDRYAPYGVFAVDEELRVRGWNQWLKTNTGLELADVLGRSITELFPDLVSRRLIPHFKRALNGEVSVLSTALHGYLLPLKPLTRDTPFEWMRQTARIAPLLAEGKVAGAIAVIEDVTQREFQAQTLREQHDREEILSWALAHLLESEHPKTASRELFFKVAEHLDYDAYLLFLRDNKESVFRLFAAGGVNTEAEALVERLTPERVPSLPQLRHGEVLVRDYDQIYSDPSVALGKTLGFTAYIVLPLRAKGELLGMLTFATRTRKSISRAEADLLKTISEYLAVALNREQTARELSEAQAQLNKHALDLERTVAERTSSLKQTIAELQTFSYTVAHDLRGPIRALKGYSDVLLEDFAQHMPAEVQDIVCRLREAGVRMDQLTRDLLEFSRISRQEFKLGPVPLEKVIADLLHSAPPNVRESVTIRSPMPIAFGHRTLIEQCVSNLLDNAIKFVAPGKNPQITIWSEPSGDECVRLWVEDKGIGIPLEAQEKVFGIFERGVTATEYEGTGIGLAIISKAMERMGGRCGVESTPGQGSRFWLDFCTPQGL
ncbi:MAG TPA: ATP-binding protein [Methylomirabilota bacterium]|nr:ATP-binding protein [Methylomirabilota bacterium]